MNDDFKGIESDIKQWEQQSVPLPVIAVRIVRCEAVRNFVDEFVRELANRQQVSAEISREDLCHEILARILQHLADGRIRTGPLRGALKRIIQDRFFQSACDDLSRGSGQTNAGKILEKLPLPGSHHDIGRLFACIAELDDEARSVILMKYFGVTKETDEPTRMTNQMIADHLRIDVRTVHHRHSRALARLRSLLEK